MTYTPTQIQALEYVSSNVEASQRGFIYWLGGVRSGKSYGAVEAFIKAVDVRPYNPKEADLSFLILTYSAPQGVQIFGEYFSVIAPKYGAEATVGVSNADPHILLTVRSGLKAKFMVRGADSSRKASRIQGLTVDGLLCDEVCNLDRTVIHQAEARCSKEGALRIYTSNKTTPYHWTVHYYVDRLREGQIKGLVLDASIKENQNLDQSYIEEREKEYDGDTLSRFIHNKFTLDEVPLYKIEVVDPPSDGEVLVFVYVDDKSINIVRALREPQTHTLTITDGQSYTQFDEDAALTYIVESNPSTIFVNAHNPYLIRKLRPIANTRIFSSISYEWKTNAIIEAAKRGLLFISSSANPSLIEAVHLHSQRVFKYDCKIIGALEGCADLFRHTLSKPSL